MKKINFKNFLLFAFVVCIFFSACTKNSDTTVAATVLKHWDVALNPKFELPGLASRTETGTASVDLMSDLTVKYTLTVVGLASTDAMTAGHIHVGDAVTSGPVILGFSPVFTNGTATGSVTLRSTLSDSLKNGSAEFYVNVHSSQAPGGLMRGQLNNPVIYAVDVAMSGANENPAVTTTATGVTTLRLATDKTLYAKVSVSGLEANDTVTLAHIHTGAIGTNGSVIIPLIGATADFNTNLKLAPLTDANATLLQTGQVYANIHSKRNPGGILRGQIR